MIYISLLSHNATEYVKSSSLLAEGERGRGSGVVQELLDKTQTQST